MKPTEGYGLLPVVGVEIEVPAWEWPHKYTAVTKNLIGQGYMADTYAKKWHAWKCYCGDCKLWEEPALLNPWPVQFKATYDGSLPSDGGEFITSPFIPTALFVDELEKAFHIICDEAIWTMEMEAKNGGPCSPSIHIHTSIKLPQRRGLNETLFAASTSTFFMFIPELFALADSSNLGDRRGLFYRSPHQDILGKHHAFISPVDFGKDAAHVEWRIWEAAFQDWEHVKAAIYFSAAATQLLANIGTFGKFVSQLQADEGLDLHRYDAATNVDDLIEHFDILRFKALEEHVLEYTFLRFDFAASQAVRGLFDRVRSKLGYS